jgi:hypothetical protein
MLWENISIRIDRDLFLASYFLECVVILYVKKRERTSCSFKKKNGRTSKSWCRMQLPRQRILHCWQPQPQPCICIKTSMKIPCIEPLIEPTVNQHKGSQVRTRTSSNWDYNLYTSKVYSFSLSFKLWKSFFFGKGRAWCSWWVLGRRVTRSWVRSHLSAEFLRG